LAASDAQAASTEVREFAIRVGGDQVGKTTMTLVDQDDGSTLVKSEADVKVDILIVHVKYWFRGWELWKDGRLQKFASNVSDNGDQRSLEGQAADGGVSVKTNGKPTRAGAEAWTTSFWRVPVVGSRTAPQVLDCDNGRVHDAKMKLVGNETCSVGGTSFACAHYEVKTDETVHLWFDAKDRLFRRKTRKFGKDVVMELAQPPRAQ
jgi:hypothetical protein